MLVTCPECKWELESIDTKVPLHYVFRVRGTHWESEICKCKCKGSGAKSNGHSEVPEMRKT
jgi:hypothetical protein